MKFKEIKDLTVEELKKRLVTAREDHFESKMKQALGQLSNTNHIREVRRDMGRLQTALSRKKLSSSMKGQKRGLK